MFPQLWYCVLYCVLCRTGRARSRNNSRHKLDYQQVLDNLKAKGIAIRVASPKLVMEEAPESYKVCLCVRRGRTWEPFGRLRTR